MVETSVMTATAASPADGEDPWASAVALDDR
jgi:hypothetical protein